MQKLTICFLCFLLASIVQAEAADQAIPDYEIVNSQGRGLLIALPEEYDEEKIQLLAKKACDESRLKVCKIFAWVGKEQTPTAWPLTDDQRKKCMRMLFVANTTNL